MGSVAEQRRSPERPTLDRIAIDHRKEERSGRGSDEGGNIEPGKDPVLELREEVVEVTRPVPVLALGELGGVGAQLGNEVQLLEASGTSSTG